MDSRENGQASEARRHLETALRHIAQQSFGRRDAPQVSLSSDTRDEPDGSLTGAIEIRIHTRNGDNPLIQSEPFSRVRSRDDVDDLLARTLSVLLMNHTSWPR
jgi:hypothetical protein